MEDNHFRSRTQYLHNSIQQKGKYHYAGSRDHSFTIKNNPPPDDGIYQRLYSSEDFLRYIGDKEITDTDKAIEYIENNILKMHQEKVLCLLVVEI